MEAIIGYQNNLESRQDKNEYRSKKGVKTAV